MTQTLLIIYEYTSTVHNMIPVLNYYIDFLKKKEKTPPVINIDYMQCIYYSQCSIMYVINTNYSIYRGY